MHSLYFLAWRNLKQHRLRTTLSALAVALGVAMVVAADVIGGAIRNALSNVKDVQTIMVGLLDEFDRLLVMVGMMVTVAAGFLVFNTFAMAVTQRRRQIGMLRSLGMTRRQVMGLVLVEALIVGGMGILAGLVGGPLLGRGIVAVLQSLGTAFNAFSGSRASLSIMALAAILGLGVTLLSVLIPAWRAACVSPLAALRERGDVGSSGGAGFGDSAMWGRETDLGLTLVVVMAVYLVVAPPGEWVLPPWDVRLTGLFLLVWLGCLALILPGLIGAVTRGARWPLARLWRATGRLVADNLGRDRRRVALTVATLALGLGMIVSMTGFMNFWLDGLFYPTVKNVAASEGWAIYSFDFLRGMAAYADLDRLQISPPSAQAVHKAMGERAGVLDVHFVVVPELSFLGSSYFSMVLDPHILRQSGDALFTFSEGSWESAMPILEAGCGLLVTPQVARDNGAWLGDTITVQGAGGPVECTIAGLGPPLVYASLISGAAGESFGVADPMGLFVYPLPGVDLAVLETDLFAVTDRYADLWPHKLETLIEFQFSNIETIKSMLNGLLLLTILAAALGVVNTTAMSVAERRRELGLLRAVGSTQRQVRAVIAGEAALMGLVGGALGLVAGVGFTVILAVVYGGNAVGVNDLPLWSTAWNAVQPAALNGLLGLAAAPFVCAGAAWLPGRTLLRDPVIEMLREE